MWSVFGKHTTYQLSGSKSNCRPSDLTCGLLAVVPGRRYGRGEGFSKSVSELIKLIAPPPLLPLFDLPQLTKEIFKNWTFHFNFLSFPCACFESVKNHKRSGKMVGKSNPKVEKFRRVVSRVVSSSSSRKSFWGARMACAPFTWSYPLQKICAFSVKWLSLMAPMHFACKIEFYCEVHKTFFFMFGWLKIQSCRC